MNGRTSHLGAARLLALAPFTSIVRDDFASRWYHYRKNRSPDLALVTTSTSMGITGTPFQSLRPAKYLDPANAALRGKVWNREGVIYARLGLSHPWKSDVPIRSPEIFADFSALVSPATRTLALRLARNAGSDELQDAMLQVGITANIFRGNPIGIFLGALDRPSVEAVAAGRSRANRPILSWDMAVQQFRSDFGEAEHATKMPGVDPVSRSQAVAKRRDRAIRVQWSDILLSEVFRT